MTADHSVLVVKKGEARLHCNSRQVCAEAARRTAAIRTLLFVCSSISTVGDAYIWSIYGAYGVKVLILAAVGSSFDHHR